MLVALYFFDWKYKQLFRHQQLAGPFGHDDFKPLGAIWLKPGATAAFLKDKHDNYASWLFMILLGLTIIARWFFLAPGAVQLELNSLSILPVIGIASIVMFNAILYSIAFEYIGKVLGVAIKSRTVRTFIGWAVLPVIVGALVIPLMGMLFGAVDKWTFLFVEAYFFLWSSVLLMLMIARHSEASFGRVFITWLCCIPIGLSPIYLFTGPVYSLVFVR